MQDEKYHRTDGAVEYTRRKYGFGSKSALDHAACTGIGGPPFFRAGSGRGFRLYPESGLDQWALGRPSAPARAGPRDQALGATKTITEVA
jgi:hypothetical protein